MRFVIAFVIGLTMLGAAAGLAQDTPDSAHITPAIIEQAEMIIGLEFTPAERDSMCDDLTYNRDLYSDMRSVAIDNAIAPALVFDPRPIGMSISTTYRPPEYSPMEEVSLPGDGEDLAYYSVRELGELVRTGKVTSLELTRLALARLKKHDSLLHCVVTLTEELALKQAAQADSEIAAGHYRGPLHGIPYGAKDLLAVAGYPTTWGATPYKDQRFDDDAAVIQKLEAAGAVLVAKLTLGALAWGDVWFADTTRNPWNLDEGSSGSSAGSAAAVSAGLVPFAIGTETWGSIVSPATRCGVTGLRPTFGRVSRTGAMALSWSMDKIGPLCRSAEDCAVVFDAIRGADGRDLSVVEAPFNYTYAIDVTGLRIGYLKDDFERDTAYAARNGEALQALRDLGVDLVEMSLPNTPADPMQIILSAEAAAAFDELTRSNGDDLLVRQVKNAWPNVFRNSRFIPAVEYVQANRLRTLAIEEMARLMDDIDVYLAPSFEGDNLLLTNLTGHPCVVVPTGFDAEGDPVSITFIGRLYDEATVLAVARVYQEATGHHLQRPPLFDPSK